MTREQRLDRLIDESLQRWMTRLRNIWENHHRPRLTLKPIGDLRPADGAWVYIDNRSTFPFGQFQNGKVVSRYGTYNNINPRWFVECGREIAHCSCVACTVYRTCFVGEAQAA